MDAAFLTARIAKIKLIIVAYEDAILALGSSATQSYKLDTGQTSTWVTKMDLTALNATLSSLYNLCATLQARLTGSGSVMDVPAW